MYSHSKAYTTANAKKNYNSKRQKGLEVSRKYYEEHKEEARAYQKAYREKKKAEKNKDALHDSAETHE